MAKINITAVAKPIIAILLSTALALVLLNTISTASALTTQSNSIGIQGTIPSPPPKTGATIVVPSNGATYTSIPITVSGLSPSGLLVKIYINGVFVGSTVSVNGSYSLQVDLFSGQNNIIAVVYDALNQAGPSSNAVTVTYNDTQFLQYGTPLTLSSNYAEYGAAPGTELDWPIILNGGTGPFALSVDWGDGSPEGLQSVSTDGTIILKHTYKSSGLYTVVVKAVDKNNETAFLQLVGQTNGAIQNNTHSKNNASNIIIEKGSTPIWPELAMIPLIFLSFWLGQRYQDKEIHKKFLG